MMAGELVQWNDARGFGFIAGDDGKRYFVHISSIRRMVNRPRAGDRVNFVPDVGRDGRPCAIDVTIKGANPRATRAVLQRGRPSQSAVDWRLPIALLLATAVVTATALGRIPIELCLAYIAMGIISFLFYRNDKSRAEGGQWRISEAVLLGIDLGFGVIGGLLGQALLRHKTRRMGYSATTLLIVLVHLLWIAGLATGLIQMGDLKNLIF
ncbi:MAG: hypothetical protein ABS75_06510 [Pelagibacterium sp. SCN 63-23]|nr:MAG: hypothetical protein ABS75_06510 [Pelagibacterium sp. SCN 63-23]